MFITVNDFVIKIKLLYIQKAPYPLTEASDLHDKLVLATRKKSTRLRQSFTIQL